MFRSTALTRVTAIAAGAAFGMFATAAVASPSSGVTFTLVTLQNFLDPAHINSARIKFQTKDATIVRMQSAVWNANSTSGWHHHPGVIIGVVTSGTITVWDPQCGQRTYGPGLSLGAVFIEGDNELMQATSSGGATEQVIQFVPFSTSPVFRVENDPPACATALGFRVPKTR
jgi:quercetin dioxygenase-like cupin family protein